MLHICKKEIVSLTDNNIIDTNLQRYINYEFLIYIVYGSEKSAIMPNNCNVKIQLVQPDGSVKVMKDFFPILKDEIIDASFLSIQELNKFYEKELNEAFKDHMLVSLHLKATMMKNSDPIMFGHCVKVYFKSLFEKHGATFKELNVNPNNGFNDVVEKIKKLDEKKRTQIVQGLLIYSNLI